MTPFLHHPEAAADVLPGADAGDDALLRAFVRTRDDVAFGRLVARHAAAVRRTALLETGNAAAAEDVAQATFIVLARRPRRMPTRARSSRCSPTARPMTSCSR